MKYKKIYVLSPKGKATGGVELAHQLVDYLRNNSQECYIVYVNRFYNLSTGDYIIRDQTVMPEYSKYNIQGVTEIEDDKDNMLVMPETYFDFMKEFSDIKYGCWWMSVDNRYAATNFKNFIKFRKNLKLKIRAIGSFILGHIRCINDDSWFDLYKDRTIHFYQSVYAQHTIYSLGSYKVMPLMDYINNELVEGGAVEKENIVLYNPNKGLEFTNKLISSMPDVQFIPLKGLSRIELKTLLDKAKLYIDFGHFPGKDRLPRESVLRGCCIITGTLGASYFYEDLPIEDTYKFSVKVSNLPAIADRIRYVLKNYSCCISDFDLYRKNIMTEKESFFSQIDNIFLK